MVFSGLLDELEQWLIDSGTKSNEEIYKPWDWSYGCSASFTRGTDARYYWDCKGATSPIASGSNESYKANNIYDIFGNIEELTIEKFEDGRAGRGITYRTGRTYKYYATVNDGNKARQNFCSSGLLTASTDATSVNKFLGSRAYMFITN